MKAILLLVLSKGLLDAITVSVLCDTLYGMAGSGECSSSHLEKANIQKDYKKKIKTGQFCSGKNVKYKR